MISDKIRFDAYMGVKTAPNDHEKKLFKRAQKYIRKLEWIPGIRMIAVVNSLSMYATHKDSDIDLFVITERKRMWIVRVCMTAQLFCLGVWRHGDEVAGNFCLSFFLEEDTTDLKKIAIEDDIYLYFWIYYVKPIFTEGNSYNDFLAANTWVKIDEDQKLKNLLFQKQGVSSPLGGSMFFSLINAVFRFFGEMKARSNYRKKGYPEGIVITKNILKFHDNDRRKSIRDVLIKTSGDQKSAF